MMFWKTPLLLAAATLVMPIFSVAEPATPPVRIALFGGSSSATTYLPEEFKHHTVLSKALEEAYPGQKVEVFNFADNGEFIARYLLLERYSSHIERMRGKNIDIAIVRTGVNDSKRFKPAEYSEQLRRFIKMVQGDFPGVRVIVETGFYLDYPAHYPSDRNVALAPYWDANRAVAKELELPMSDVYRDSEKATAEGNWDFRIRSQDMKKYPKKPAKIYWEADLDAEYGKDSNWFNDIHPSPNGVRLAVKTEFELLKTLFPERLPSGTGAIADVPQRDQAHFITFLDCPVERLELKGRNADRLQKATDPGRKAR